MSVSSKHTFEDIIERPTGLSKDNITVINSDTVSALVEYSKISKTCILNMASHKKPGGGVKNGARAQEESLLDVLIYQNQLVIHYIHLIKMSVYTQKILSF
jgi:uncharacterized protein (TIGR02452 family)